MTFIADHCVYEPVVSALLEVKFDIKRIKELTPQNADRLVLQASLNLPGVLITLDRGMPSQAYAYGFAVKGVSVVLLRWKTATPKDWQQMVEVILRDSPLWEELAKKEAHIISANHRKSRARAWSTIPPLIAQGVPKDPNTPISSQQGRFNVDSNASERLS